MLSYQFLQPCEANAHLTTYRSDETIYRCRQVTHVAWTQLIITWKLLVVHVKTLNCLSTFGLLNFWLLSLSGGLMFQIYLTFSLALVAMQIDGWEYLFLINFNLALLFNFLVCLSSAAFCGKYILVSIGILRHWCWNIDIDSIENSTRGAVALWYFPFSNTRKLL